MNFIADVNMTFVIGIYKISALIWSG
jgi:hypothetical protein